MDTTNITRSGQGRVTMLTVHLTQHTATNRNMMARIHLTGRNQDLFHVLITKGVRWQFLVEGQIRRIDGRWTSTLSTTLFSGLTRDLHLGRDLWRFIVATQVDGKYFFITETMPLPILLNYITYYYFVFSGQGLIFRDYLGKTIPGTLLISTPILPAIQATNATSPLGVNIGQPIHTSQPVILATTITERICTKKTTQPYSRRF